MLGRAYSVMMPPRAVTGAITLVQLKAASTVVCQVVRAWCSQTNLTSSAMQQIEIVRKTAAATVTSFTPLLMQPGDAAAASVGGTAATGINATVEGTDGDILYPDAFNVLTGWLWVPTIEERIVVPPGGIIGVKLPVAPGSSMTTICGITFREIG